MNKSRICTVILTKSYKSLCTLHKIGSSEEETARVAARTPGSCLRAFYTFFTPLPRGTVIHHGRLKPQSVLLCLPFGIIEHVILRIFASLIILILIHSAMIDKRIAHPGHIAADLVRVPCRLEAPLSGLLFPRVQLSDYVLDYLPVSCRLLLLFFPILEFQAPTNYSTHRKSVSYVTLI